ncbi:MAG: hypothetical protein R2909_02340 [Gemmatimonadales bacterium]
MLSDDRGYQILDFVEFLESKYAERATPSNIFAKMTETVEDVMRAGKLPVKAISGTMGLMEGAGKMMRGVAAAAQAVVDEAVAGVQDAKRIPSEGRRSTRGAVTLLDYSMALPTRLRFRPTIQVRPS